MRVARRYAVRVWWADEKELVQEAWLAILTALRPGGPYVQECGVPRTAYAWRAAVLHLREFLWRQSAPVRAPHHKLKELRGVHRAEVTEESIVTFEDPAQLLEEKRWTESVRSQVHYLLDKLGADSGVAARVVVHEEEPAEVARDLALPTSHVYRTARAARTMMSDNAMLHQLLKERDP